MQRSQDPAKMEGFMQKSSLKLEISDLGSILGVSLSKNRIYPRSQYLHFKALKPLFLFLEAP